MEETEFAGPDLSREDWALVARLLESRQRELLAEIWHTKKRAFRDALHENLDHVDRLLSRIPANCRQE